MGTATSIVLYVAVVCAWDPGEGGDGPISAQAEPELNPSGTAISALKVGYSVIISSGYQCF